MSVLIIYHAINAKSGNLLRNKMIHKMRMLINDNYLH